MKARKALQSPEREQIVSVHGCGSEESGGVIQGHILSSPTQIQRESVMPTGDPLVFQEGGELGELLTFIRLKPINKKLWRKSNGHMVYVRAGLPDG